MKITTIPNNFAKSLTIAIAGVLIFTAPAMSRIFYFRGTIDNGQKVIGIWDNNHGRTCIKLSNSWLLGTVENDHGIPNSDPMRFHSEKIVRQTRAGLNVRKYKTFLQVKVLDSTTKALRVLSESELKSLRINGCDNS